MSPIKFLSQVRQEFLKIHWPDRKKTILSTVMVFVMVFIMAMYFFLLDWGLSSIVNFLLKLG
ncbi:preprotein translocase subunit SecE [Rickettsiales bacterium LUAb2]